MAKAIVVFPSPSVILKRLHDTVARYWVIVEKLPDTANARTLLPVAYLFGLHCVKWVEFGLLPIS
jgi:hypothetical protein